MERVVGGVLALLLSTACAYASGPGPLPSVATSGVSSVNGQTGAVHITASTITGILGATPAVIGTAPGTARDAAAALSAENSAQTTANGALAKSNNLSDLTNPSAARSSLQLGTAAVANTSSFDAAGAAAAAMSAAEAASVPTTAVGSTVAPLVSNVVPSGDLPAATSNTPGAMTLTTAAAQAPVQSVAGRGGPVVLTHADISDWTSATGALSGSSGRTVTINVAATGSGTIASAAPLTANENVISSCPAGAAVALPTSVSIGQEIYIANTTQSTCLVLPDVTGDSIGAGAAGAAVTIDANSYDNRFVKLTATQWGQ